MTHVAAEMHKYKDKKSCCAVTRSLFKTLLDPHYDYIGVSFSIFLNLDDCQEYGQKEMFWIKCYTADLTVAQLWGPVQMLGQNNWCY